MSQRRTLILIAAIAIGALASFLVWNYVGGIQDQAYNDAERVKVFLVKAPIPRGTSGQVAQASIVEESIPKKFKPANAIVSLDDISGRVAKGDLVANQVVVADMFVEASDPEAAVSFADNLIKIQNKDQTTFTMNVDAIRGVNGLIVPGDYVNVMVTNFSESIGGAPDDAEGGGGTVSAEQARFLYQKVQVLAVDYLTVGDANAAAASAEAPAEGGEAAAAPSAPVQKGMVTLIVPTEAAQVLLSVPAGNLYLTLVSKDYEPKPTGEIDVTTLPSDNPKILTPYGPDGAKATK
ncbi:Flp pilus assembly protein CpaB [Aquihabitans daechungensis]|uniref:Flp pilus assembly protein CpaB n=1 Tax=Aquihabitans daechungensis TaxID=1052257 RepID=UPI003BA2CF77